jgi:hypothetical protein
MKGVTHEVALLGGSALSKMCDRCYHAILECDMCFNLTSFAEGAINNQDKKTCGVDGDGIVCSHCIPPVVTTAEEELKLRAAPVPVQPAPETMEQKIAWLHATYPNVFDERGNVILRLEESND